MKKEILVHFLFSDKGPRVKLELLFRTAGFEPLETNQDPDIIFLRNRRGTKTDRDLISARRRFGWKPLLCLHYTEPSDSKRLEKYFDYTVPYLYHSDMQRLTKALDHRFDIFPKTKFCNFVFSQSSGRQTKVRIDFCQKLMEHKQVDCPGKSLNNMPRLIRYREAKGTQAKLDFQAHYKFTITFENSSVPGYLSEKIFHPLMVGSIPIYWGCPEVAQYINPDCFINCHDFSSFDDVIKEVLKIDSDQQLYESYLNAPPIIPSTQYEMRQKRITKIMRDMTEAALSRRSLYESVRIHEKKHQLKKKAFRLLMLLGFRK